MGAHAAVDHLMRAHGPEGFAADGLEMARVAPFRSRLDEIAA